jgi:hypothetical protein
VLRQLASRAQERIAVGDIAAAFGERSFAAVILLFGLLTIVSVVPGATYFTGAPLVLATAQSLAGRRNLWLPERIRATQIRTAHLAALNDRVRQPMRRIERMLAPRFGWVFAGPAGRIAALVCLVLSVTVFLPIPLGNLLPGLALSLFAIAVLARDGLLGIVAIAVGILSLAVLAVIYGGLIVAFLRWIG